MKFWRAAAKTGKWLAAVGFIALLVFLVCGLAALIDWDCELRRNWRYEQEAHEVLANYEPFLTSALHEWYPDASEDISVWGEQRRATVTLSWGQRRPDEAPTMLALAQAVCTELARCGVRDEMPDNVEYDVAFPDIDRMGEREVAHVGLRVEGERVQVRVDLFDTVCELTMQPDGTLAGDLAVLDVPVG